MAEYKPNQPDNATGGSPNRPTPLGQGYASPNEDPINVAKYKSPNGQGVGYSSPNAGPG